MFEPDYVEKEKQTFECTNFEITLKIIKHVSFTNTRSRPIIFEFDAREHTQKTQLSFISNCVKPNLTSAIVAYLFICITRINVPMCIIELYTDINQTEFFPRFFNAVAHNRETEIPRVGIGTLLFVSGSRTRTGPVEKYKN